MPYSISSIRDIKYKIRSKLGGSPELFYKFCATDPNLAPLKTTKATDIVIEGYPRCANSFSVLVFSRAQNDKIKIAHHLHAPAQIFKGIAYNIPCVVLIRSPHDAVKSFAIREPHWSRRTLIKAYYDFYRPLLSVREKILTVKFEDVIKDMNQVILRINRKFHTEFSTFPGDPNEALHIESRLHQLNKIDGAQTGGVGYPTKQKEQIKARFEFTRNEIKSIEKLDELYNSFLS